MYNPNARSQSVTATLPGSLLVDSVDSSQREALVSQIAAIEQVCLLALHSCGHPGSASPAGVSASCAICGQPDSTRSAGVCASSAGPRGHLK